MQSLVINALRVCFGVFLVGGLWTSSAETPRLGKAVERFAVYYADRASVADLDEFDLLVLDSTYHPDLRALSDRQKTLLGYVSLGEVERHRTHFRDLEAQGLLLHENPHWEDSFFVDVRDPRWLRSVIEEIIPGVLRQGFDGLFFDTLDNPIHLERTDPIRYAGMRAAAVRLVRSVRYHYPTIPIMLNRAYEILPEVSGDIDIVLGESCYADYDFETGSYRLVSQAEYERQVEILLAARERHPHLHVFTLDYCDPTDLAAIRSIYRTQRAHGFVPYVATLELDLLVAEPKP